MADRPEFEVLANGVATPVDVAEAVALLLLLLLLDKLSGIVPDVEDAVRLLVLPDDDEDDNDEDDDDEDDDEDEEEEDDG